MKRYNVSFNLIKGSEITHKFEVLKGEFGHNKFESLILPILKKKYPYYRIEIISISPALTALSEIL